MNHETKVIINGSRGRMGMAISRLAQADPSFRIVAEVDQGDSLEKVMDQGEVLIDFSFHAVTPEVARLAAERKKALVIGTTGHTDQEKEIIRKFASQIPSVWASNYSTGVNVLFYLTRKATEILGEGYDLEVIEMHHRQKMDAPSGTAATLVEILAEARRVNLEKESRHGRHGIVGKRTPNEIGVHAVRGGDVVGDHTVIYAGIGERVELTHKASSRDTFAAGALRAAKWVVSRPPGIYDMQDVLGLKGVK